MGGERAVEGGGAKKAASREQQRRARRVALRANARASSVCSTGTRSLRDRPNRMAEDHMIRVELC